MIFFHDISVFNLYLFDIYSVYIFSQHYANTPMQYTAIFHGCKNVHFRMKFLNIFLIFAQNIDCGYTLEPPHNLCFGAKIRRKKYTPVNPSFTI